MASYPWKSIVEHCVSFIHVIDTSYHSSQHLCDDLDIFILTLILSVSAFH